MPLKVRNRFCEVALCGWAEPFAGLGRALGLPDERPALRAAWRSLLVNQAHDSICGCSIDDVHKQMEGRYQTSEGLASETAARALERLAGLGPTRRARWDDGIDVAVWNPSPHPRTDIVRFAMDGHPVFMIGNAGEEIHSLVMASLLHAGITVDGEPARVVVADDPGRVRMVPEQDPWEIEFVAKDVPPFGWRRYRLKPGPSAPSADDDGRRIAVGDLAVEVHNDGTLSVSSGGHTWSGLMGVEDIGDRGDTYDFDPVAGPGLALDDVRIGRSRHANGVEELSVRRVLSIPSGLAESRDARAETTTPLVLSALIRLVPGTARVDLDVTVDNAAEDHRLRLRFPTGETECWAATTFDVAVRTPEAADDEGWVHPAPATFPHQGWLSAGGLTVGAPGLPEAELTADGTIAVTLLRSVGWLSLMDLRSRPIPAGPGIPAPGAQCLGRFRTQLHLWLGHHRPGELARLALDAEVGFRAVAAGPSVMVEPGHSLLALEPSSLVLSACKPAEEGDGLVLRVLNVGDETSTAVLRLGVPVRSASSVRLDETPDGKAIEVDGPTVTFPVPAHGLHSVLLTLEPPAPPAARAARLEAIVMQAALDAHYKQHPEARPSLADLAIAAAELDGHPLATQPEELRRAADEIVQRHPDAEADDVLLWAEARAATSA
jgi:mannosylglycerate hydrolase